MNRIQIAKSYIHHLAQGDLPRLLNLFAQNATVISPVYGSQNFNDFYTQLFADTNASELKIKGIFEDSETGNIALHFDYSWTLKNDRQVNFEVVDIIEFDAKDQISKLTIIYDTIQSRELVKTLDAL